MINKLKFGFLAGFVFLSSPAFTQTALLIDSASTIITPTNVNFGDSEIQKFGGEFEIAPKKTYVSLKRKKQFIILNPASKTRFEIGFNLKGAEAKGKLENEKPNGICSHKINLSDISEIDKEVIDWIRKAFDNAG